MKNGIRVLCRNWRAQTTYILFLNLLISCSSGVPEVSTSLKRTVNKSKIESKETPNLSDLPLNTFLEKCINDDNENWEDTLRNFECISSINHSIESYLSQGNSPEALKMARIGMIKYPFDGRLKNNFQNVITTYTAATERMAKTAALDCAPIIERINFFNIICPDRPLIIKECATGVNVPLEKIQNDADLLLLSKISNPVSDRRIEIQEFKNVEGKLDFSIKKNNEDNFQKIMALIMSHYGFAFESTEIDLSNASNENAFNIEVLTKLIRPSNQNPSTLKEICTKIQTNFNYVGGQEFWCGKHGQMVLINLGKRDLESLSIFSNAKELGDGLSPKNVILRVDFNYPNKKNSFYYLQNAFDEFVSYENEYPSISKHKMNRNGTLQLTFEKMNRKQIKDLKNIEIRTEPLLTYQMYIKAHYSKTTTVSLWKEVVLEHKKIKLK